MKNQSLSPFQLEIKQGISTVLPTKRQRNPKLSHAPYRNIKNTLSEDEIVLAIKNALRYIPSAHHSTLAKEFLQELSTYGRIYMYRYMPSYKLFARPLDHYPYQSEQAGAIMLMIQNNLDHAIAKHPEELITYGGNGAVFQNWAQYRLTMQYLSEMSDEQTLVLYSGHPLGLFPSSAAAPRLVITNGMMIPNYSSKEDWNKYNALGVTQYGQMTAGSFMYIGPQGIVHGTTITLLNAARKLSYDEKDLGDKLYVTSGLGGMSGAQALAAKIVGINCIIAEVDQNAINQRIGDGYISENHVFENLESLAVALQKAKKEKAGLTLVFFGNIVDLWEFFVQNNIDVELGSDQTSLHNIDDLGYCPAGYSFEEAEDLLTKDKKEFLQECTKSLRRHVDAINILAKRGMYFWDYGNAFLKEAGEAEADIFVDNNTSKYKYPSYVEDIMGPICFDFGFGPFRWVCTSGDESDLNKTDKIAAIVLKKMLQTAPNSIKSQLLDNIKWIESAQEEIPIVGSLARILYADAEGRIAIALAFNEAIRNGEIKAAIVLGRDHHDVSGTDSPFRETANIYDGSKYTADMAIHNVIGDSFRGATWVSIHNGGGVGWGEAINGGFGLVIDGSQEAERKLKSMLFWDVNNGIARRAWARNPNAIETAKRMNETYPNLKCTIANLVDDEELEKTLKNE